MATVDGQHTHTQLRQQMCTPRAALTSCVLLLGQLRAVPPPAFATALATAFATGFAARASGRVAVAAIGDAVQTQTKAVIVGGALA